MCGFSKLISLNEGVGVDVRVCMGVGVAGVMYGVWGEWVGEDIRYDKQNTHTLPSFLTHTHTLLFGEVMCRPNAFQQKIFNRNFSTKFLRQNVLSTKCLSTNNIAFYFSTLFR